MRLWYKVQKARIGLKWAKIAKEAKKLCVVVVLVEFLGVGVVYYVCQNDYIIGLFQPKVIYIETAQAKEQAKEQPKADNETIKIDKLIEYIHFKESTNGTAKAGLHITCKAKGLSNEYGYNPPKCYNSNETVIELVKQFIKDREKKGFSEQETLCIYNTGMSRNGDCEYAKNYK